MRLKFRGPGDEVSTCMHHSGSMVIVLPHQQFFFLVNWHSEHEVEKKKEEGKKEDGIEKRKGKN